MQSKLLPFLIIALLSVSCVYFLDRTDIYGMPKIIEQEATQFPESIGYVNDFEELIDRAVEIEMTRKIISHENKTTNQIAIITLNNIEKHLDFENYTLDLANYWGMGVKGKDNGILIAVSKKLRKIRIQVGDGLLNKLTNQETKSIIDNYAIPNFKAGQYNQGIELCLTEIIKELEKE